MTAATRTPELTREGWLNITAEYRNDDPAELGLMDDCWHRGEYWRYTVVGLDIVEEGDCYADAKRDHHAAYRRLLNRLCDLGHAGNYAVVDYRCNYPRRELKLIERF